VAALALPLALLGCGTGQEAANGPMAAETPSAAEQATGPATGQPTEQATEQSVGQPFPDIVAAELTPAGDGIFDVEVTVSSPYDSGERYADGWRVLAPDGTVLGEHQLAHDHASEQPFTRTQRGVRIPDDVTSVTIEGRDLVNGYGGGTVVVEVATSSQE
jgi:hypothetical protein